MCANVRRYVLLAQSRGGTRFCNRDRGQKISIQTAAASRITGSETTNRFLFGWRSGHRAKTVTPGGGPRREPGQAAPPTT